MAEVKRIVCLANSRKTSGRCVAGKEITAAGDGAWLRPVSARPSEEVSVEERRYENGEDPDVLDVIKVPLLSPKPRPGQPENWLLDPKYYWEQEGRLSWDRLAALADDPAVLWKNESSSYNGLHDRIPEPQTHELGSSIFLIRVQDLKIEVYVPGAAFGNPKRRVQASFTHRRIPYSLWVTDPTIESEYLAKPNGAAAIGDAYVTVSLGAPHEDGNCYKLVAAIITPDRARA